jgi:choline dehydrogenase-like flavoprotein
MECPRYDVVIVGSGMGGGTLASALAAHGARVLVVERGGFVQQEAENWSARAVWGEKRYRANDTWLDESGTGFRPYTHYCVGGNSKFWGCVLYRLRREDFAELEHHGGTSPAWPIGYEDLAPYYTRAERLYCVHGAHDQDPTEPPREPFPHPAVPHQGRVAELVPRLREVGLHPAHLPLGLLRPGESEGCQLCGTCNAYPCRLQMKADVEVCALRPATARDTVTLWTDTIATRLLTNGRGDHVHAVELVRHGRRCVVEAPLFVVSCGAVNSAALLLRSVSRAHPRGLGNSSGLVGRNYMAHFATMLSAFMPPTHDTTFAKTVAINDWYFDGPESDFPLGSIQAQGRSNATIAKAVGAAVLRLVPDRAFEEWFARSIEWLVMSEDLPSPDNRVTLAPDGRIRLEWRPRNARAHRALVAASKQLFRRIGCLAVVAVSLGVHNTTHQCGTVVFGNDPRTSVLDPFCRSHDVGNLFVVDASFFPSSAAVNPALTIAAQALRVADHIEATHFS